MFTSSNKQRSLIFNDQQNLWRSVLFSEKTKFDDNYLQIVLHFKLLWISYLNMTKDDQNWKDLASHLFLAHFNVSHPHHCQIFFSLLQVNHKSFNLIFFIIFYRWFNFNYFQNLSNWSKFLWKKSNKFLKIITQIHKSYFLLFNPSMTSSRSRWRFNSVMATSLHHLLGQLFLIMILSTSDL